MHDNRLKADIERLFLQDGNYYLDWWLNYNDSTIENQSLFFDPKHGSLFHGDWLTERQRRKYIEVLNYRGRDWDDVKHHVINDLSHHAYQYSISDDNKSWYQRSFTDFAYAYKISDFSELWNKIDSEKDAIIWVNDCHYNDSPSSDTGYWVIPGIQLGKALNHHYWYETFNNYQNTLPCFYDATLENVGFYDQPIE